VLWCGKTVVFFGTLTHMASWPQDCLRQHTAFDSGFHEKVVRTSLQHQLAQLLFFVGGENDMGNFQPAIWGLLFRRWHVSGTKKRGRQPARAALRTWITKDKRRFVKMRKLQVLVFSESSGFVIGTVDWSPESTLTSRFSPWTKRAHRRVLFRLGRKLALPWVLVKTVVTTPLGFLEGSTKGRPDASHGKPISSARCKSNLQCSAEGAKVPRSKMMAATDWKYGGGARTRTADLGIMSSGTAAEPEGDQRLNSADRGRVRQNPQPRRNQHEEP